MPPKRKAVTNSEIKAKRAKGETDLKWDLTWKEAGKDIKGLKPLLILDSATLSGSKKVVGLDIDFTVIQTKSGRKFATGAKDWTWWNDCVPDILKKWHNDGYRICFFTNQAGIEKGKASPNEIRTKVEDITSKLDIPVLTFVCTGNNHFRKPSPAAWDYFVEHSNGGVKVDLSKCMYVGDAAGRAKEWAKGKSKDFSCSDRMFAANIGIDFQTPEEFFLKESPAKFEWGSFDPVKFMTKKTTQSNKKLHSEDTELILMVGPPASGKSTFSKRFLVTQGYEHVNRDILGTPAKCMKKTTEALESGKSVVVDNTNPSKSTRSDYISIAEEAGVPVRCFVMQTPLDIAKHLNLVRQNQTNGEVRRIPDVGYNMYKKNYEEPVKGEGFKEILKIDFSPKFDSKRNENIFKHWTTAGH